ncbi:hypothetical protein NDU88_000730 [Pleurodeles waltl]|uniref:Uncharacterized protein n=1 Tax=Pleurodeles waltl TaxID=8319 RepID=A0AAV7TI37_PLEWA|nr:hypothetical protein NDU88_000730 [Pleurodeles waltl]
MLSNFRAALPAWGTVAKKLDAMLSNARAALPARGTVARKLEARQTTRKLSTRLCRGVDMLYSHANGIVIARSVMTITFRRGERIREEEVERDG